MSTRCTVQECKCKQFKQQSTGVDRKNKKGSWFKPLAVGVVCLVGGAVLAPIAVPAALGAIGFTSGGVAGGSIAAAMMSSAGNVAAGSAIATMQSIGAAGLGAAGTAVGAGVSGVAGVAVAKAAGAGEEEGETHDCCNTEHTCITCQHCRCKHETGFRSAQAPC
ncbi:interferon alpha-inducible protein 27-like protein 2 [Mytilus californianus]|uniref:interferon alpha-inducible protein 27-like protein 2 n=1 Tax=Mytilus californianus TaxID=6549 RepID=UPI002245879F|nr:interferon alpha-inducible protein 27-like protein 2 [Mytilus californianus]XP_052071994.1 interferon alpha-inducible protein 27-like protein 2 [Mytilus californianus]XP_052071995.1 interferon alpha-inducible protein 27-like protein 2 [Mytilus californianus]XP_052071996.1 interferon alpha-inducible protein 27-like protein 2 [Mytilus californianus]XP_052071997.1 interferon alpha-inducible protein 27-like protein 2 [Mytilus californianus]